MKPILKSIYIMLAIFMLASCTPKTEEQATQKAKAETTEQVAKAKEGKAEAKQEDSGVEQQEETPKKTPEELAREKKIDDYYQKLKTLRNDLEGKEAKITKRTPLTATLAQLKNKIADSMYHNERIKLEEVVKDEDLYHCKQKVEIDGNKVLEYEVLYGEKISKIYTDRDQTWAEIHYFDPEEDKIDGVDFVPDIKLISSLNIGKLDKEIMENQVHGEICSLKDDPNGEAMTKLFEAYETEKYPDYDLGSEYGIKVLDYVKANFSNSGYDEYFILYGRDYQSYKKVDNSSLDYIYRIRLYLVEEDKIIKDYIFSDFVGGGYIPNSDRYPYRGYLEAMQTIRNFGYLFSQGWVNDFNQNGVNEIYLSSFGAWHTFFIIIEFNGADFDIKYVSPWDNGVDPIFSMNWANKTFMFSSDGSHGGATDTFQWDADIKEFVLKERTYEYKLRE